MRRLPVLLPTRRLFVLALATLVPFALSEWVPALGVLTPVLAGGLGVLLVVDARLTAPPGQLGVGREIAERLSLGVENAVGLVVENRGPRAVRFRVRDEYPVELAGNAASPEGATRADEATRRREATPWGVADADEATRRRETTGAPILDGEARPGETLRLRYGVTPPRRGDYGFGRVVVRYGSVLGLFVRQHAYPCERAIKVYPNLRDLQRYELLVRRGLQVDAGTRAARRFGPGTEFERLREYVPDDEFRRINWKATARRGIPISAEYETERSQNVIVLLDAGRLMGALADNLTKLDHALNAGLLLTYAASRRGDRVGMLVYADRVRAFLPPQRGRRAFLSILEQVYRLEPELTESDHARAFGYLATHNPRRSLVVLFTDVADPDASRSLVAHLGRASRHHLTALVTVSDPALTVPADRAPATTQELYEKMVAQRLLDERRQVLAMLEGRGVITLDLPADRLSAQVVATYLELKVRGRL